MGYGVVIPILVCTLDDLEALKKTKLLIHAIYNRVGFMESQKVEQWRI